MAVGRDSSGREYIGESSVMYSVKYQSTRKGTRILPATAKFKSALKIYKNNKGKDNQSVIGEGGPRQFAN